MIPPAVQCRVERASRDRAPLHMLGDPRRAPSRPIRRVRFATLVAAGVVALQLTAGTAIAADPAQARKDLKAIGIEYTEQDFAKVAGNWGHDRGSVFC